MATRGEYDVFISHASEDKAGFVEPLVHKLVELGIRPWYDNMSLDLGDSLRENIDQGLASSEYGVVVLSPSFFAKRWPERELNGLVQKAMGEGRKVILPIWHEVTYDEVVSYSLPLADLVAARSSDGVDAVAESIARVVRDRGGTSDPDSIERAHRLSEQKLLATAKKMVADPTQVVGIHELADALARDAYSELESLYASSLEAAPDVDIAQLWQDHRSALRSTASFCALAANLGDPAHYSAVQRVLAIVTRNPGPDAGTVLDAGLWQYPASYLVYATCLAALQKKRLNLVVGVLAGVAQPDRRSEDRTRLVEYVSWDKVAAQAKLTYRPSAEQTYKTPLSDHLFQELPSLIGAYFIDEREFEHVFDLFEYTLGLVHSLRSLRAGSQIGWIPNGRYLWKDSWDESKLFRLEDELAELGGVDVIFDGNTEWFSAATAHSRELAGSFQ